jgi:restriction system protein
LSIWQYDERSSAPTEGVRISRCPYCRTSSHFLWGETSLKQGSSSDPWLEFQGKGFDRTSDWEWVAAPKKWIDLCPTCGWWSVSHHSKRDLGLDVYGHIHRASGTLRNLDPSDLSVPLDELSQYLLAKYDDRFRVNPKRYEDLVGSVFKAAGYHVRVCSYSNDDGVDVFVFDGDSNDTVGVQVKRHRGKIEAHQIREFSGALMLNDLTRGIYVTTSEFTRGATSTAARRNTRGVAIRLWNAVSFYDCLRLATRTSYSDPDDPSAPFAKPWQESKGLAEVATISAGRG